MIIVDFGSRRCFRFKQAVFKSAVDLSLVSSKRDLWKIYLSHYFQFKFYSNFIVFDPVLVQQSRRVVQKEKFPGK